MPEYFYEARSLDGKVVKGNQVAEDVRSLSKALKNEGLFLTRAISKMSPIKKLLNFQLFSGVSASEKIVFAKNLSIMVATGLSLVKSFETLAHQTRSKALKSALNDISGRISKGESLSEAMTGYPKIFSKFFISMVRVGEESGTLDEVLKILSLQLEKEHRLKSAVQGAMIYPIIVLCLMVAVGFVIAVFVLPKLKDFFSGINADIPFYTRMLIDFGDYSVNNWPVLLLVPFVIAGLIVTALRTKPGKWLKDTAMLRIPVFSPIVKKNNCAILIRSLSSLLSAGVPLATSLEVASETVGNFYFKEAVNASLEKVKKGEKLSLALNQYEDIFPFGVTAMLEVGEETGKTSTVLKTLADFYEDEVVAATSKLSTMIEPILLIVLGLMVGVFAISIIEPMYSSLEFIK